MDVTSPSSTSGVANERNPPISDQAGPSGSEGSSRILEDSGVAEEVGINVDFARAWDGKTKD